MTTTEARQCGVAELTRRLAGAARLWLFLDYDGTLADFAPTPEHPEADRAVVHLLSALARSPHFRLAIISGRRLDHLEQLVPVAGISLAGTYGIDLRLADGRRIDRVPLKDVRPQIESLKPAWTDLIAGRPGFFLEDKGWGLALHARFAVDAEAGKILALARRQATEVAGPFLMPDAAPRQVKTTHHQDARTQKTQRIIEEASCPSCLGAFVVNERFSGQAAPVPLRLFGGHKFLEIVPALADKGEAVNYLLAEDPWEGARPVYLGDDDKDEAGFAAVKSHGGLAVVVARAPRPTAADCRLASPLAARRWLARLA